MMGYVAIDWLKAVRKDIRDMIRFIKRLYL
jgi:hypothetical protein